MHAHHPTACSSSPHCMHECLSPHCMHADHPTSSTRFCSQTFPNSPHPRDCDENGLRSDRRTASGDGMTLADFVAAPNSREAELEEAHVLALRLYTTRAYLLINIPLRDLGRHERGEAHPLPVTVAFLAEAIRRLRAVGAKQANARSPVVLYRGLANRTVPSAFFKEGGTEYAPMSTTNDLSVAVRYSASRSSVLLRMVTKSFIERGADISYLSAFPGEAEVLFPVRFDSHPCRASTCLQLSHSHVSAPPPRVSVAATHVLEAERQDGGGGHRGRFVHHHRRRPTDVGMLATLLPVLRDWVRYTYTLQCRESLPFEPLALPAYLSLLGGCVGSRT